MNLDQYGPDKPCRRTEDPRCAEYGPHKGGAHINQRHPLYDGPDTTILALGHRERQAAFALLKAGAPMPEVVDLVEEIHRLQGQVAAVRVDKDRAVNAAMARAADCTEHGKDIERLEEQVQFFSQQADKNDAARIALLNFLFGIEEFVRGFRQGQLKADLSVADVVDALDKAAKKASAAHQRAWKK